jgi:hypothetical protein
MPLAFDLQSVTVTEFGIGRDEEDGQSFTLVPVDTSVQTALAEMAQDTWSAMGELGGTARLRGIDPLGRACSW